MSGSIKIAALDTVNKAEVSLVCIPNTGLGGSAANGGILAVTPVALDSGGTVRLFATIPDNADGQAPQVTGLQGVVARLEIFNGATWDRVREANASGLPLAGIAAMAPVFFNGAAFDRQLIANGDAQGAAGMPFTSPGLFNGATFDRQRSSSAANLAALSAIGAQTVTLPGNWTLTSAPVAATQATATRAAGGAGVRHVLTSIQASINAVAAVAAPLNVVVRDGASGVGTILWQERLIAVIGTDSRISISGLNIVGSAATAMTVEFTAAPPATDFETLSATGYDAQ